MKIKILEKENGLGNRWVEVVSGWWIGRWLVYEGKKICDYYGDICWRCDGAFFFVKKFETIEEARAAIKVLEEKYEKNKRASRIKVVKELDI